MQQKVPIFKIATGTYVAANALPVSGYLKDLGYLYRKA